MFGFSAKMMTKMMSFMLRFCGRGGRGMLSADCSLHMQLTLRITLKRAGALYIAADAQAIAILPFDL